MLIPAILGLLGLACITPILFWVLCELLERQIQKEEAVAQNGELWKQHATATATDCDPWNERERVLTPEDTQDMPSIVIDPAAVRLEDMRQIEREMSEQEQEVKPCYFSVTSLDQVVS